MVVTGQQHEVVTLEAHPGDIARAVGAAAHGAVAVGAPFARQFHGKPDGATKAAALTGGKKPSIFNVYG